MLENEKDYMYLKDPTYTSLKWILKAINTPCFVSVLKEGLHAKIHILLHDLYVHK